MSPEGVGESDGPDFLAAPAGLVRPVRVQAPLWGPSLDSPPGEYQTVNFLRLEDSQPRVTGWVGIGSGDTLAGRVELIAVEGADEPPFTYSASGGRTQIRAQMRAVGLGDADAPALVTPDDDILPHPGLLDELGLQEGRKACDEVPALGKRGRQAVGRVLPASGRHRV